MISTLAALLNRVPADQSESAVPAGFGEEMLPEIDQVVKPDGGIRQRRSGRVVGPVNNQRLADNVLARHETPKAAVERGIAIVAHRKVVAGGNDHLAILHVVLEHSLAALVLGKIRLTGEIIAVGID